MGRRGGNIKSTALGFGRANQEIQSKAKQKNHTQRGKNARELSAILKARNNTDKLKKLEPLLKVYAQSGTTNPDIFKALLEIAEAEGNKPDAELWGNEWVKYPSNDEKELWNQLRRSRLLNDNSAQIKLVTSLYKKSKNKRSLALHLYAKQALLREDWKEARAALKKIKETQKWSLVAERMEAQCIFEDPKSTKKAKLDYIKEIEKTKSTQRTRKLDLLRTRAMYEQGKEPSKISIDHNMRAVQKNGEGTERLLIPILIAQEEIDEAEGVCKSLLKLSNSLDIVRHYYSECLLRKGKLREGFKEKLSHDSALPKREGSGERTIYCDGTLSETIFYSKWIKHLTHKDTIVYTQPPLINVLKKNNPSTRFLPLKNINEHIKNKHLKISSLPIIIKEWENKPDHFTTNLKIEEDITNKWRNILNKREGQLLIGINWHGSALRSTKQTLGEDIELESFSNIAKIENCKLISLQKGTGKEQLEKCSFRERFHEKQDEINAEHRIEHIAAIILSCDVVICDNSGPGHLSSNLGQNTIINTRPTSEWYWHQETASGRIFKNTITSVFTTDWENTITNGWKEFNKISRRK